MTESRGKKGKKARWQLQLGLKEVIFAGLGIAGLLMMSFALGTLAGRGDIYRVLHNWGLLGPEAGRAVQVWPPAALPPSTPVATPSAAPAPEAPAAVSSPPAPTTAARAPAPAPTQGAIATLPSQSPAKKKSTRPDHKAQENGLEKMRREVAHKLKFQNSLDPAATKPTRPKDKPEKATASKATSSQVFVAKFRDGTKAKAQLAKMRKQGEQVTLKEGKDGEGHFFAIYRQIPANQPKSQDVAQSRPKKNKTGIKPSKSSEQPGEKETGPSQSKGDAGAPPKSP